MEQNDALSMKGELLFPEGFIVHVFIGLEEKWVMSKKYQYVSYLRQQTKNENRLNKKQKTKKPLFDHVWQLNNLSSSINESKTKDYKPNTHNIK